MVSLSLTEARLDISITQFESALNVLNSQYPRVIQEKSESMLARYLLEYARANYGLKKYDISVNQGENTLSIAKKLNIPALIMRTNQLLAKSYEAKGMHKASLKAYKTYSNYNDSLMLKNTVSRVSQLDHKYKTLKANETQLFLENQNTKQLLLLKQKEKNQLILIGGMSGLLLIIGFIAYYLKRKHIMNQTLLEKNSIINKSLQEKDVLLREIHHRVKNNLQVISSLLNLQSNYISDDAALEAINEGKNRVNSMALIHQKLYQEKNLMGINIDTYFQELIESLCETYNITESDVTIISDIDSLVLDVDTMIPLGLITNELVSNAFKHAFDNDTVTEKRIIINLNEKDNKLYLSVSDNGRGMDKDDFLTSQSFGNKLIQAFLQKLDAQIEINSVGGSQIQFIINNYQLAA
jgi:two-component sensor histidine kinase